MRRHAAMEQQLDEAEAARRCLHATNDGVRQALMRRRRAGEIVSPMPGLFIRRTTWEALTPIGQMCHLVRGLAQIHSDWVFGGVAAACILGLWIDYHTVREALRSGKVDVTCTVRNGRPDGRHMHRIHPDAGSCMRVDGVKVTAPERTAADCARMLPFDAAMQVVCCVLHNGVELTSIIGCAAHTGEIGKAERAVYQYASPLVENGGEAKALARFIQCGFAMPQMQVVFVDPQTGRTYRVDFLWLTNDGRIIVVELDGLVKYTDPQMTKGRSLGGIIDDERERVEGLKHAGVHTVVRIRMEDLNNTAMLRWKLCEAGVPVRR
ncbi:hypothetical protein [Bifidobacterium choerinum]|nr:hypothetical protein [Bifidobacterium choerinum]